jgi:hypothetical protein
MMVQSTFWLFRSKETAKRSTHAHIDPPVLEGLNGSSWCPIWKAILRSLPDHENAFHRFLGHASPIWTLHCLCGRILAV